MEIRQIGDKWFLEMADYMADEPKRIINRWRITWAEGYLTPGQAFKNLDERRLH